MENIPSINLIFTINDRFISVKVSEKTRFNVAVEKFLRKAGINTDNKENIHILFNSNRIEATDNRTIEEIFSANEKQIRMDVILANQIIGA